MITASKILESIISLNERNVVNTEEIDKYIRGFSLERDADTKKWLETVFRKYLINDYPNAQPVKRGEVRGSIPSWMSQAFERGDELYRIELPHDLDAQVNHILDYFVDVLTTEREDFPRDLYFNDITRISFPDAVKKAEDWMRWLSRLKAEGSDDPDKGEFEVLNLSDGMSVYQIVSASALSRESQEDRMGHCVGGEYFQNKVKEGKCKIFSLRDRNNHPYCTMELEGRIIRQIKGPFDHPVGQKYQGYVVEFLNSGIKKGWFHKVYELENIDSMMFKGYVHHNLSLPNEYKLLGKLLDQCSYTYHGGDEKIVKDILDKGVNPNQEYNGKIPLVEASGHGHTKIVKMLIDYGADVNLSDNSDLDSNTPLTSAACYGKIDVVRLLLDSGADPNLASSDDFTPLVCACANGEIDVAKVLLEYGADVNHESKDKWTALLQTLSYYPSSDPNLVKLVNLLLRSGADPNAGVGLTNMTPLLLEISYHNTELSVVELLLKYRADPNLPRRVDGVETSPLFYAIKMGDINKLELLLKYGADPNQKMNNDTAIKYLWGVLGMTDDEKSDMEDLLKEYGAIE
jgi:ankyrin repeat protein